MLVFHTTNLYPKLLITILAIFSFGVPSAHSNSNNTLAYGHINAQRCAPLNRVKKDGPNFLCVIGADGRAVLPGEYLLGHKINGGMASAVGLFVTYISSSVFVPIALMKVTLACDLNFHTGATASIWTDTATQNKLLSIYSFSEESSSSTSARVAELVLLMDISNGFLPPPGSVVSFTLLPPLPAATPDRNTLSDMARNLGIFDQGAPIEFRDEIERQCAQLRSGQYSREVRPTGRIIRLLRNGQIDQ